MSSNLVNENSNRFCIRDGAIFNLDINKQAEAVGLNEDNIIRYWVESAECGSIVQVYEVRNFATGEIEHYRYFKD